MQTLRRFVRVTLALLIGAVAVSGCAYTKYMAEAKERQQNLNAQLAGEQDEAKIIQDESVARKTELAQLRRETKQLSGELGKHQARLAELSRVPPRQRTVSQQAEINKMQGEIDRLKKIIDVKKREIERRAYD
jgi:DNA repair exonuclease SbcCD ATPase subunit